MSSSDSEGFESADEGLSRAEKKERKKRNSSSNYSDNALEADAGSKYTPHGETIKLNSKDKVDETEGWDDFNLDDDEPLAKTATRTNNSEKIDLKEENVSAMEKPAEKAQDSGWDNFEDWGDDNTIMKDQQQASQTDGCIHEQPRSSQHDKDLKQMTDKLAAMSAAPPNTSWGWGWGVDSILSSASAGLTTLSNQVSQGLTTVLETRIGAPDPEELAKQSVKEKDAETIRETTPEQAKPDADNENTSVGDGIFSPFGSILKLVGSTGSKVITGGLDTLETIGRKTIEVLQDGDPYLAKKRALLGLEPGVPVLSQVLREAKAKAEEEDRIREERQEAKEIHYERLFDDYDGLVHLEALEMLAKQVEMKIEEQLQHANKREKYEIKETLQQVSELCELPEDEDDDEEEKDSRGLPADEILHEKLQKATEDLGVKLQFQPIIKQYKENIDWLANQDSDVSVKLIHKRAIASLAQATALAVEIYHKAAEMLYVKPRRMTADETDAMTQMTQVFCKFYIYGLANLYTGKLNTVYTDENINEVQDYERNIYLQAGNSETYIKNAFILTLPILQIGLIPLNYKSQ